MSDASKRFGGRDRSIQAQVTLTPTEAKRLIAMAVSSMEVVKSAFSGGKILLKGGTTVSAVAEALVGIKLAISGRISIRGAKASGSEKASPHRLLIEKGNPLSIDSDEEFCEAKADMGERDVLITGANAIDVERNAAMMVGRTIGGTAVMLYDLMARGVVTIIAVGWEKLVPGRLRDAIAVSGSQKTNIAMGMAVGLVPIHGMVVTESDAITLLAGAQCVVIGAGGILGAEGSTTVIIRGDRKQVKKGWYLVQSVKGAVLSGIEETFDECYPGCFLCRAYDVVAGKRIPHHRGCSYFKPSIAKEAFGKSKYMRR